MEPRRDFRPLVVILLSLWFSANAVLSRFVGTCTMGDTDAFATGVILGLPPAWLAIPLLFRAPARPGWRRLPILLTAILSGGVLIVWAPLAISTGLQGHHLCGPEFDAYLVDGSGWDRFIPLAQLGAATILLVGAVSYLWRASGIRPFHSAPQ